MTVGRLAAADVGRHDEILSSQWRSAEAASPDNVQYAGFEQPGYSDACWTLVAVPHDWYPYAAVRGVIHGDVHGTAWYRRDFRVGSEFKGRRVFLYFEGVGSFATVWVNGHRVGGHAGGRTTFTLDITEVVHFGAPNLLAVRADEPDNIQTLPWVCGGSSNLAGFSEGSQPLGIFRPVHLVVTDPVRIEPFGVHVWNDSGATETSATLHLETEIRNYGASPALLTLRSRIVDANGHTVAQQSVESTLNPGQATTLPQTFAALSGCRLWSPDSPSLYRIESMVEHPGGADQVVTEFGIRTLRWPIPGKSGDGRFLVNEKPVFLNGIAEYEHELGASQAFSAEEIRARVRQVEAAGFNAFRDAHQPHNLRYQAYWDHDGLLWWPQFAAHIWYDTPAFRRNFKALLADWVRERRNSPSVILWGLENESTLPADFAKECADLIRSLDPTASTQRLITTCNGGRGTDWNVPQNWSGTYNGELSQYAQDLKSDRVVGEYGAWRSLGLHSEGGFQKKGVLSEDREVSLLETKIRLGESARDDSCGQFLWLFMTHENPGRPFGSQGQQLADGTRSIDQVGPANNKGLLTYWGEPTDAYYLYRSNYVPAVRGPMVYIASHTWPDRWTKPGSRSGIAVFSNCDEVELYNDAGHRSLGIRKRGPIGTHLEWNQVPIETNVLYAEGRIGGKTVATDSFILDHLPTAAHLSTLYGAVSDLTSPAAGQHYLYRVHCGGDDVVDHHGQTWEADCEDGKGRTWGSTSWASRYPNLPSDLASQRPLTDPIAGTEDQELFKTIRYGRDQLTYRFAVPTGRYQLELYFVEPWYGRGGGLDCRGWRVFDVAVNGHVVLHDLDLWAEVGYAHALKKVVSADSESGQLVVAFPRVLAGQAVISAIAVSTADASIPVPVPMPGRSHTMSARSAEGAATQGQIAGQRYGAETAGLSQGNIEPLLDGVTVRPVACPAGTAPMGLVWTLTPGLGGVHPLTVRYTTLGKTASAATKTAHLEVSGPDGTVYARQTLSLAVSPAAHTWVDLAVPEGVNLNAGTYELRLEVPADAGVGIEGITLD